SEYSVSPGNMSLRSVGLLRHSRGSAIQLVACGGQPETVGPPFEEADPQAAFQAAHPPRHRRMIKAQFSRGLRERSRPSYREQNLEVVPIHACALSHMGFAFPPNSRGEKLRLLYGRLTRTSPTGAKLMDPVDILASGGKLISTMALAVASEA